jgi:hypothetical protein
MCRALTVCSLLTLLLEAVLLQVALLATVVAGLPLDAAAFVVTVTAMRPVSRAVVLA